MKRIFSTFLLFLPILFVSAQSEFSSPVFSVGVVVENLEKSIDFYTEVIGMTQTGSFSVSKEKCTNLGLTNKYQLDVTILKLEDSPQSGEWKLMSVGTKANHPKQNFLTDDTGMQYITIFVKHVLPVMERAKKHGVDILSQEPSSLDNDRKFILIQDPDGTFIELIGPA